MTKLTREEDSTRKLKDKPALTGGLQLQQATQDMI